jgi:PAS domain S-box-containing protein
MTPEPLDILDHIDDLISIHDKDFTILFANKAFADHLGMPREEIVGEKCYALVHASNLPVGNCPHRRTLAAGRASREVVVDPKSGRTLSVATYPHHAPDGTFAGSVHVARDITGERDQLLRLVVRERLAALDQLAASIAQELRQPLELVAASAERLLSLPEGAGTEARALKEAAARCAAVLAARAPSGAPPGAGRERRSINGVIDHLLETFAARGQLRAVQVERRYGEGVAVGAAGEELLRLTLPPLIANALDAMDGRGTLTIAAAVQGGTAVVDVGDTGPGIAPEHIEGLFRPFFTTKAERGGTGLGLSVARAVAEDRGGRLEVLSSWEGKGSTFRISVPC